MRFACAPVDAGFFDTAPWRFFNQVELDCDRARAFAILEDGESWPQWFGGMQGVQWTTPKPFGIGTTRTVTLTTLSADEQFFRWEQGRRFSFYFTGASLPLFRSLAEDYLLEPLPDGRSRFTYVVGIDPGFALRVAGPRARRQFEELFAAGATGLQNYCRGAR